MIFGFLNKFRKASSQAEPPVEAAVLIVPEKNILDKQVVHNRIALLLEEIRKTRADRIFILNDIDIDKNDDIFHDVEQTTRHELRKNLPSRKLVVLFTDNYHISHEYIDKLIDSVPGENAACEINTADMLISNLGLKTYAYCIPGKDILKYSKMAYPYEGHETSVKISPEKEIISSLYRQMFKTSVPLTYVIETTNHCNYSCYMCPYHGKRQEKSITYIAPGTETHMPLEMFKKIVDEVSDINNPYEYKTVKTVVPYNRGEFLNYPHWKEALSYIKQKNIHAYFSTNGSLWTQDDVNFIMDIGLETLQVSVDGISLETHSAIRLNDEFNKVIQTLKMILKQRETRGVDYPLIQLAHTLNEKNYKDYGKYVDFWINKVDALFLGPENFTEPENFNKRYKVEYSPPPFNEKPSQPRPPCGMLRDCMWIMVDGKCNLCIGHKNSVAGTYPEMSVMDLVNSKLRWEIAQFHFEGKYDNYICRNCEHWFCTYGRNSETENYSLWASPDTQYYKRKKTMEKWWG